MKFSRTGAHSYARSVMGLRGILFRSAAESVWATFLQVSRQRWQYESNLSAKSYIPDFHVGDDDAAFTLEIKGGGCSLKFLRDLPEWPRMRRSNLGGVLVVAGNQLIPSGRSPLPGEQHVYPVAILGVFHRFDQSGEGVSVATLCPECRAVVVTHVETEVPDQVRDFHIPADVAMVCAECGHATGLHDHCQTARGFDDYILLMRLWHGAQKEHELHKEIGGAHNFFFLPPNVGMANGPALRSPALKSALADLMTSKHTSLASSGSGSSRGDPINIPDDDDDGDLSDDTTEPEPTTDSEQDDPSVLSPSPTLSGASTGSPPSLEYSDDGVVSEATTDVGDVYDMGQPTSPGSAASPHWDSSWRMPTPPRPRAAASPPLPMRTFVLGPGAENHDPPSRNTRAQCRRRSVLGARRQISRASFAAGRTVVVVEDGRITITATEPE